jgi:hypothetical protein
MSMIKQITDNTPIRKQEDALRYIVQRIQPRQIESPLNDDYRKAHAEGCREMEAQRGKLFLSDLLKEY